MWPGRRDQHDADGWWHRLFIDRDLAKMRRRGGRRWTVTPGDVATARKLAQFIRARRSATDHGESPPRLVARRAEFRYWTAQGRVVPFFLLLDNDDPQAMLLGIWLLGRCHQSFAISIVGEQAWTGDARRRREVVRALRRLNAWRELKCFSRDDDLRIRRMALAATESPQKPFTSRIERYLKSTNAITRQRHPVSFFTAWDESPGRPPKSSQWIRAILERLRRRVRGG